MKVLKKYDQHRRDCTIDMECEGCGKKEIGRNAYDDRNFWDNVVPNMKCEKCGETTKTLGKKVIFMQTKYPEGYQI